MNVITLKKKSIGLNKVSCDCGFYKFATTGGEADGIARRHAVIHEETTTVEFRNGVEVNLNPRTCLPGRWAGNGASIDNDAHAYQNALA